MSNFTRKLEVLANVCIVAVALLLGAVLVKIHLLPKGEAAPPPPPSQLQPGSRLPLADINWADNGQTLLLVLSDTCHYCTESADFYKRLAQERAAHDSPRLVAVLPQEVERGRAYLDKLGVSVDQVLQAPVNSVGARGTPALILVDGAGAVTESWVGKLPPDRESEVLGKLRAERAAR